MMSGSSSSEIREGHLSDIAQITMGQSPSGETYNETGNGTVFFQGRAEFGWRFPKTRLYTTSPKRMAKENDVLLSVRAPVGDINIAKEDCCIGRGLAAIHPKDGYQSFVLYSLLAARKTLSRFNSEGTVFGSINKNSLSQLPIMIPSKEAIKQFERQVQSIDRLIRLNSEESQGLEALRDQLLPKLLTGEVEIH